MRKIIAVIAFISILALALFPQSITQISFIIKKAIPEVENIAVIYPAHLKSRYVSEARTAQLIYKKNVTIFGVSRKSEISNHVFNIRRMKNVVVVVMTDDSSLSPKGVKYIIDKLSEASIPVISNRTKDTLQGALMSIFKNGDNLEKHLNRIVATALGLNLSENFLKECTIDVE